jgi:hypothetical protein
MKLKSFYRQLAKLRGEASSTINHSKGVFGNQALEQITIKFPLPKSQSQNSLYCPLTAVARHEHGIYLFRNEYASAASMLNIPQKVAHQIVRAADLPETSLNHRENRIRQAMLRALGLNS